MWLISEDVGFRHAAKNASSAELLLVFQIRDGQ
jgi:hypothetical protein